MADGAKRLAIGACLVVGAGWLLCALDRRRIRREMSAWRPGRPLPRGLRITKARISDFAIDTRMAQPATPHRLVRVPEPVIAHRLVQPRVFFTSADIVAGHIATASHANEAVKAGGVRITRAQAPVALRTMVDLSAALHANRRSAKESATPEPAPATPVRSGFVARLRAVLTAAVRGSVAR